MLTLNAPPKVRLFDHETPNGKITVSVFGDTARILYRQGYYIRVHRHTASLAAGKDAWMRKIKFECKGCGAIMEAGTQTELPDHCEKCSEEYFSCNRCAGTHHPDDPC